MATQRKGLSAVARAIEVITVTAKRCFTSWGGVVTWLSTFLLLSNFLPMISIDQIQLETNWKGSIRNGVCKGQPSTTQSRRKGVNGSKQISGAKPVGESSGGNRQGIAF